jgi:uncharacterized phage protein (TIGR02216 family)
MAAEPVDWPGLMRLGLGALRLAPEAFWSMTPGELRLALEGAGLVPVAGAGPMGRHRLAELMAAFPDGPDGCARTLSRVPAPPPHPSPTRGEGGAQRVGCASGVDANAASLPGGSGPGIHAGTAWNADSSEEAGW